MTWKVKVIFYYIKFIIIAKSKAGHGIHSPYVYNFTRQVLKKNHNIQFNKEIEKERKIIYKKNELISEKQFGAVTQSKQKTIGNHAILSSSGKRKCKLLQRIVKFTEPDTIIEFGTSVGISTAYMANVSSYIKVFTFEGNKAIAETAQYLFDQLNLKNITLQNIDFDSISFNQNDFSNGTTLFVIDGDHTYEATIKNIKRILNIANENSVIVIDDIRWSEEMYKAWNEIIKYDKINISIDLFTIGILTLRKSFQKEHFKICYF